MRKLLDGVHGVALVELGSEAILEGPQFLSGSKVTL